MTSGSTNTNLIEALRTECSTNPVAADLFHFWGARRRARYTTTVRALYIAMDKEGFSHSKDAYRKVFKFLAELGIGRVVYDKRANIKALTDLNLSIPSLGRAACGEIDTIDRYEVRHSFDRIVKKARNIMIAPPQVIAKKRQQRDVVVGTQTSEVATNPNMVHLALNFHGKIINVSFPKNLSGGEVAELVTKFNTSL